MSDRPEISPFPATERGIAAGERGMNGYASGRYAESLAEFGQPLELPRCGGWALQRPVPGSTWWDLMGCYPLFCCRDWSGLKNDLNGLGARWLTLALVVDPFAPLTAAELRDCFDVVSPFKEHFVVDLGLPSELHVTRHHRYYARKSLQQLKVQTVIDPVDYFEDWVELYAALVKRHQLRGIKAFSRACFRQQLSVPGLVMFTAALADQVVCAQLWYVQGEVAYSHLTAVSEAGYACRATYAIYWTAIEAFKARFAGTVRWLDLGAGAGVAADQQDGLAEFKRGWASGTRPVYFCGKTFDRAAYQDVSGPACAGENGYFPAYRRGEFS